MLALGLAACASGDADDAHDAAPEDYRGVEDQPDDAAARFLSPQDGDTVSSPVTFELAADGVTLAPVGAPVAGEGHLHLMVDADCFDTGSVIPGPSDDDEAEGRFHLGDGSDIREIELEPGTRTVCVQLGDGIHTAYGQTETITITIE